MAEPAPRRRGRHAAGPCWHGGAMQAGGSRGVASDRAKKLVPGTVKLMPERDEEALWLTGATASCGSFGAGDLGPDREGLLACGPVLGGGDVIAAEVEEVVDLVVGREKPLRLAG
jgi:hypothetical protein